MGGGGSKASESNEKGRAKHKCARTEAVNAFGISFVLLLISAQSNICHVEHGCKYCTWGCWCECASMLGAATGGCNKAVTLQQQ
jgi:hypothetical protein